MSRLVAIIDAYKDLHGQPSDSSIARAIGVKPQTLSSWRTRGIKEPPDRDALRKLAQLTRLDYESEVLRAALIDASWIEDPDAKADLRRLLRDQLELMDGGGGDDRDAAPIAARRNAKRPPRGPQEQKPD